MEVEKPPKTVRKRGRPKKSSDEKLTPFLQMGYIPILASELDIGMDICFITTIIDDGIRMFRQGGIIKSNFDNYCMVHNRNNPSMIFSCQLKQYTKEEKSYNNEFYYNPCYIPHNIVSEFKMVVVKNFKMITGIIRYISENDDCILNLIKTLNLPYERIMLLADQSHKKFENENEKTMKEIKKDRDKIIKSYRKLYGTLLPEDELMEKICADHPDWFLIKDYDEQRAKKRERKALKEEKPKKKTKEEKPKKKTKEEKPKKKTKEEKPKKKTKKKIA